VLAPEAANNAKEGGALIPTLLFGIPGSGNKALLLGGFILIGIDPGLEMITDHLDLSFIMIWSLAVGNIVGAGTCLFLAGPISKITTIKYTLLAPFMFGLIFFAAFQATRDWGDLIALMIMGTLGVYMKRFGWPRPALLIGYVLSSRVEAAIYHTTQVYRFTFLERPIVILLLVLTVISIFAALRFKIHGAPVTETGVHSHRTRGPQIAFFLAILAFTVSVIGTSTLWEYETALYPVTMAIAMLACLIPLGIGLLKYKKPHTVFYDSEREAFDAQVEQRSNEHYLLWLLAMLGLAALFGFVIAIGAFIYSFLRVKAEARHWGCALGAGVFILLLGIMSELLNLEYPQGILQDYLTLPWPLQ
jgi:hypothetical protein